MVSPLLWGVAALQALRYSPDLQPCLHLSEFQVAVMVAVVMVAVMAAAVCQHHWCQHCQHQRGGYEGERERLKKSKGVPKKKVKKIQLVPPGVELGLPDSESGVIANYTMEPLLY